MTVAELFFKSFGRRPDGLFSAPGRVNLIGEHTDYNDGLVLPFAIDARTTVAAARTDDGALHIVSAQRPGRPVVVTPDDLAGRRIRGWAAYVAGAAWALRETGAEIDGFQLAISTDVPVGAGLSSSAALECATLLALATLSGQELPMPALARLAQRDENDFVGMPCGLMDQMASAASRAGTVMFFDIGRDVTELIPFDPAADGLTTLLIDTRAHHSLADGEYAKRRSACERAAAELDLASLRELDDQIVDGQTTLDDALARLSDDELRRRVRHVITENERVRSVVTALKDDRLREIGPTLVASHTSLRDDFEVSVAELDVAVEVALDSGALGARMTGGGFGGSVIGLVPAEAVADLSTAVTAAFAARSWDAPVLREVSPADGARVDALLAS